MKKPIFDENLFLKYYKQFKKNFPPHELTVEGVLVESFKGGFEHLLHTGKIDNLPDIPKTFAELPLYFKNYSKKLKYEMIFNVMLDRDDFELGILECNFKNKIFLITSYFQGDKEIYFEFSNKYIFKKFPEKEKLIKIILEYLNSEVFPIREVDGTRGTWGSKLNFNYKLKLSENKSGSVFPDDFATIEGFFLKNFYIHEKDIDIESNNK